MCSRPRSTAPRCSKTVFPDGELDWLVLFSSTSTATAPAGQVDYVAANEYLNAYAKSRSGGKTRVRAIDWGIWADVGMAADAMAARTGARRPGRRSCRQTCRCWTTRPSTRTATGSSPPTYRTWRPLGARRAPHPGG